LVAVVVQIEIPVRATSSDRFDDVATTPTAPQRQHPNVEPLVEAPARGSCQANTRRDQREEEEDQREEEEDQREEEEATLANLKPNPEAAPPATHAWLESMTPWTSSMARREAGRDMRSTVRM
jgi:hypothetical protein